MTFESKANIPHVLPDLTKWKRAFEESGRRQYLPTHTAKSHILKPRQFSIFDHLDFHFYSYRTWVSLLFVFEPVCNVNLLSKQHSNWIILTSAQHCWKNLCTLRFEKLNMATECGWYSSYWFTNCKDVQTQSTDVMQCNMVLLHVQQLLHPAIHL